MWEKLMNDTISLIERLFRLFNGDVFALMLVVLVLCWQLYLWDKDDKNNFKIANFFRTNGYEDVSKMITFLFALAFIWGYYLEVKGKTLTENKLIIYCCASFGYPMFYALLRVVNSIFGKQTLTDSQTSVTTATTSDGSKTVVATDAQQQKAGDQK